MTGFFKTIKIVRVSCVYVLFIISFQPFKKPYKNGFADLRMTQQSRRP